jgi:glycosyltransferase involved in cell wall biosynthesis
MISRVLFFNQVTGPLFLETAEWISELYPHQSTLLTGDASSLESVSSGCSLKIVSAPAYRTSHAINRLLTWFGYSISALHQLLKTDKSTLIFFVSNPPILAPILYPFLRLLRRRYVVLVYDIHPDVLISLGKLDANSGIVRMWRWVNRYVYEGAECVLTIGVHMRDLLKGQFDVEKTLVGEIGVLPIWANTDRVKPISKEHNEFALLHDQVGFFTVLYSGNMGASHDIETILEAVELLTDQEDIKFVFIGHGHKKELVEQFIADKRSTNILLLPLQSDEVFPLSIAMGDVSLVALDSGAERLMIPSKVSYYMAAGSAIIGICDEHNDLYEILKESGGGFVISSGAPRDLANAILELRNDKAKLNKFCVNARHASETIFSKQMTLTRLLKLLERACLLPKN